MKTKYYKSIVFDHQLFADETYTAAGSLVNTSQNYVNAYTGESENFTPTQTLAPAMQDIYNTALLKNVRMRAVFGQFAKKHRLPANHGRVLTFKKFNTLPRADRLIEGVIPRGKKMGMTSKTVTIDQYGMYVAVSDILDLHAVDNMIVGATEELGASAAETMETLTVAKLLTGTNYLYCDNVTLATGAVTSTPTTPATMRGTSTVCSVFNYRMITKAVNMLEKAKADMFRDESGGYYVGVIHSDIKTELLNDPMFIDISKYSAARKLFIGEIGTLGGVRFVVSPDAPVQGGTTYQNQDSGVIYDCMIFGREAYDQVDVEGGNMRIIVKPKGTIGGPLEQFSTVGYKFETNGADQLYPDRLVIVRCCSPMYSSVTQPNY